MPAAPIPTATRAAELVPETSATSSSASASVGAAARRARMAVMTSQVLVSQSSAPSGHVQRTR